MVRSCSPSRAALLTGQWAHATGMLGLEHRGFRLSHPQRHLANVLRASGYGTVRAGVNHVVSDASEVGYEHVLPARTHDVSDVAPAAAAFLKSAPREPFFLDVGFVQTHRSQFPREHHPEDDPRSTLPPASLPDLPEMRQDAARFASAARRLDAGVGQVLDALDDAGLAERTLVICTTDHGISFPRHKCTLFDGGIEVMLMLRGPSSDALPDGFAPGTVCDALVSQVDLFPTIRAYLGLPAPGWLSGHDLLPILRGETTEVREDLFAEITYHAAYQPERAVRTGRYKYIRRFGDELRQPMSNLDAGQSGRRSSAVASARGPARPAGALDGVHR